MIATKSSLSLVLAMTLLTGQFLLAGCSSGTTTSEQQVTSPPPSVDTSTPMYRRQ
jgi:uncharacterized lipoprotein YajG